MSILSIALFKCWDCNLLRVKHQVNIFKHSTESKLNRGSVTLPFQLHWQDCTFDQPMRLVGCEWNERSGQGTIMMISAPLFHLVAFSAVRNFFDGSYLNESTNFCKRTYGGNRTNVRASYHVSQSKLNEKYSLGNWDHAYLLLPFSSYFKM